jgi:carbon-monoxide dehydrogenase small subunit
MVLSAIDLLRRTPKPTAAEIDEAMAGNICRCTGYVSIADAVQAAACTWDGSDIPGLAKTEGDQQ